MSNKYDSAYREIVYVRKIFLKTTSAYQGVIVQGPAAEVFTPFLTKGLTT